MSRISTKKRRLISIFGCVQGVGFRPFVYRLAHQYQLAGFIRNSNSGVDIDVQGEVEALEIFQKDLVALKPERASITEIRVAEVDMQECDRFEIQMSERGSDTALALLPDTAICDPCLRELGDPHNRRYLYPFIHCMTCGPRFSLFLRMPFDRGHTTMTDFPMCKDCQSEYADPDNRRFYSQTNCCPQCGPELRLFDNKNTQLASKKEAIETASEYLQRGKIVAVKNTGGYLLLVDATNEQAVMRLRLVKQRAKKPFALLMHNLSQVKQAAFVNQAEEEVLASPAAPILLLKKKPGDLLGIAPSVAFDSPYYGIMLGHNAMQHLLLSALRCPLVATSGNLSGRPICITEEEAFSQLSPIADVFLVHNRRIMNRLDDSIVQVIAGRPMLIRRARGYIPHAVPLPPYLPSSACILAVGGQQKNSFAFSKNQQIYLSQHIGNLDSADTCKVYDQEVEKWEVLLGIVPSLGVGDKHPEFYTTEYLQKREIRSDPVQHHMAHVFAGMLDNQLPPPLFSISWDGTGLGDDRTIWGGEAFIVEEKGIRRFASLFPFKLPGSEKAVREPRRCAWGALYAAFEGFIPPIYGRWMSEAFSSEELNILPIILAKGINAPSCSSMGRLFDAVSALLGCCLINHFEGQAALALEALASRAENEAQRYALPLLNENGLWLLDWRGMLGHIFEDKIRGRSLAGIALGFHLALVQGIVDLAHIASLENVLLTGGVMQNKLLAENTIARLKQEGFKPFWHHQIPPNDGGLAAGQLAGKIWEGREYVSSIAG